MYASDLERLFFDLIQGSDAARSDYADLTARFESLRNYGRLPRGRENHATLLTDAQMADAILGLATDKPGWAGHAATILRTLKPVGGTDASFERTGNFHEAVQLLLKEKSARERLQSLVISTAESATNANGYASLQYKTAEGDSKAVHFVHQLAISLHGAGAEKNYKPEQSLSVSARQLVLKSSFFDSVAERAASIRALKPGPSSDGSEYDASEAEERRLRALGVQQGSRYLNIGVDNQVTWPKKEMLINFDRYTMVLFPKIRDNVQSISMDLAANKLSIEEARTVINRFLSILTWCDDQFAVAQDGWSGNPIPVPVSRRNLAFATTQHWLFDRRMPKSEEVGKALALYREARNAEQNFIISYAVLNYYKIIELRYPEGPQARKWLTDVFPLVSADLLPSVLPRFHEERGSVAPADHIYRAYRVAVAHASPRQPSDPDVSAELTRLYTAAEVLRPIARHFIKTELKVSDSPWSED